jgi:hypothetical protein
MLNSNKLQEKKEKMLNIAAFDFVLEAVEV